MGNFGEDTWTISMMARIPDQIEIGWRYEMGNFGEDTWTISVMARIPDQIEIGHIQGSRALTPPNRLKFLPQMSHP